MALNRTVILHQQHLLPCSQLRWDLMPQKLLKLVFALLDFPFQIILLLQLLKMWHQSMTFMNKLYKPTVYSMSYRYSSLKKISNSQTPSGTKNCQNSKSPTPEAKIGTYEGGAGQLGGKSAWERGPSRDKGKEPWGTANTLIKIPLRKSRFKETILYRHRKEIEISRELQESDCSHDCSVNQTHTHTHMKCVLLAWYKNKTTEKMCQTNVRAAVWSSYHSGEGVRHVPMLEQASCTTVLDLFPVV